MVAANIAYEKCEFPFFLAFSFTNFCSVTSETLKCRNVNTQFVSCISPHISISKALTNFGISEDTTYMLAVVMDPTPEKIANLRQVVVGTELQGVENELKSRYEADLVRQKYDISQRENATSELLDSIVSRIACREIH